MKKKAQVTIFVILGIMLIVMVLLFMYLKKEKPIETGGKPGSNIRGLFQSCLEDQVKKTVKTITEQGGYLNNTLNISFKFREETIVKNISYLCYTSKEFISCTNQEPVLMNHLVKEIEKNISTRVRACFDEMASSLGNQGEVVEANYNGFRVEIVPRRIIVYVDGEITSTKSGQTITQRDITGMFQSRLYEITEVVKEIVSQEATYCNFELLGFMLFYPEFEIDKTMTRDSTAIYRVKHTKGVEEFNFAVRSCSFPPGF